MRNAIGILAVLLGSAVPTLAGPLPWSYYVRFGAPDSADAILLGTDTRTSFDPVSGAETSTPVYLIYRTYAFGPSRINFETPPGPTDLFSFNSGNWEIVETLPANTVANRFTLNYGFENRDAVFVSGVVEGTISADGAFSSGTGNFTIGLDEERELDIAGQRARLVFGVRESESASTIEWTVTPEAAKTPEPATLVLAGLGFAGVLGARFRRRIAG